MKHEEEEESVSIPAFCRIDAVDGSEKVQVVRGSACKLLHPGCRIRIGTFHSFSEYTISSEDFHKNYFTLNTPFLAARSYEYRSYSKRNSPDDHPAVSHKMSIHLGQEELQTNSSLEENTNLRSMQQMQYSSNTFTNLPVWKVIAKSDDRRLLWRIQYDEGMVPWFPIYCNADSVNSQSIQQPEQHATYFHVKQYWKDIERACQDDIGNMEDSIHQQRLQYFELIPWNTIIKETFRAVCIWYPVSSFIDSVKWSKLAKKMNFFSSMKNVAHEVDMAFHRHSKERKMDLGGMERVCREMAYSRYPSPLYNFDEALMIFLWSTVVTIPSVNEIMWRQSQIWAMQKEMIRTCAQIRIAAFWRHILSSKKFQQQQKAQLLLSKFSKMVIARKKAMQIIHSMQEEHRQRRRRRSAVVIQKEWRRYFWRHWYRNMLNQQIHQQRLSLAKRKRLLLEENRILSVWRLFMQSLLQTQVQMTVKKLLAYDRALLAKVPIMHSSGKLFSTCVYQTPKSFIITCRETQSLILTRLYLSYDRVIDGLSEEPSTHFENLSLHDAQKFSFSGHLVQLAWWLLSQIIILVPDDSARQTNILLKYEVNRQKKWQRIRRIQCQWRARVALKRARCEAVCQYEKTFDRVSQLFYYVHIKTGRAQWTKPQVLGHEDIPDPPDEWRTVTYKDPDSGDVCTYYENLKTGQKSWISEEIAARMVQKQFRFMQSRTLLGRVDVPKIVHAVQLVHQTESNFSHNPEKLCNKVNYALLSHCIRFEHRTAKQLYQEAMEISPHHPVICRAYGLFIMSLCEDSMDKLIHESTKLFHVANEADPDLSMFQSAINNFFSLAIVLHPRSPNAILNWALVNQIVLSDYRYADKMYRLGLSMTPNHESLRRNFEFFESQRYPGGLYASGGPPSSAISRSRLIEEREEWGEWKKRRDALTPKIGFDVLWFNSLTKTMQFDEPRWKVVWEERVKRSTCTCVSEKGLWTEYYDPLLRKTFYYSKLTEEYVCKQPQHVLFLK